MTTVEETYQRLKSKMADLIPDFELQEKAKLIHEINRLKVEKNAVILGHNYMEPALYHGVADYTGDSLELCHRAKEADKDVIVFCGVEFMAETAKILNPDRKVLIPSKKAGCSLASSITAADVRQLKEKYPGVPVVTYINTYADVKAETDVCCTSGNAAKVVASLDSDKVIFIPDEYLARNVARETGKTIIFPDTHMASATGQESIEKVFIGWHGKCEVHDLFTVQDIESVRSQYPDVVVLAHPECPPEVAQAADFSGSTSAMIKYVKEVNAPRYLLLTECSMADNIIAETNDKDILRLCSHRCPHMAQITLEDTKLALEELHYEVTVPEDVAAKAKLSIDRMMEIN
ncbi:quinolinate synthase NadA [Pseudobacteriovorax antillogorgiicola]|uniref:Quinolinate synthase n=1 Tax=Pseudobacteriovorax antillogorgiicola TaxID=1513793 RepID=A0A1Y6C837_9BACT|nr:quinolinate synthase NadA [Pseudobacteriovorax antillogorgiicola]TCS51791.1 quinolinate synthetase [Pseudobacteriovorax antillogorgiicola]SMF50013.1 quinolinate synthetase [Pseudobacteriovorax antillogorgiicola]